MKLKVALVALATLGGAALSTGAASAMPNGLNLSGQVSNVEQVRDFIMDRATASVADGGEATGIIADAGKQDFGLIAGKSPPYGGLFDSGPGSATTPTGLSPRYARRRPS